MAQEQIARADTDAPTITQLDVMMADAVGLLTAVDPAAMAEWVAMGMAGDEGV